MKTIPAVLLTGLIASGAAAATRTWTGAGDHLWSNPANWAEGVAPVGGDDLVFPAGASNRANVANIRTATNGNVKFASITIEDDYVISGMTPCPSCAQLGFALGSGGLHINAAGNSVVIQPQIELPDSQPWTVVAASARLYAGTASSVDITLDTEGDLEIDLAGNISVTHTGDPRTVRPRAPASQQQHEITDGWATLVDRTFETYGHKILLNGDACTEPPCDDGVKFDGSIRLAQLHATGGMVEVTSSSFGLVNAEQLTLSEAVIFQTAIATDREFTYLKAGSDPAGTPTVTPLLNDATLSVVATEWFEGCTTRTVIANNHTDAIGGTFAGLPEGAVLTASSGQHFRISYEGGRGGNDVVITALDDAQQVCGAVHSDFDGNRVADLLWRRFSTGEHVLWTDRGGFGQLPQLADLDWNVMGTADFNGDLAADIFWRHDVTGENYLWLFNGVPAHGVIFHPLNVVADAAWQVAALADFDADGTADVLWRHAGTGENYLYLMDDGGIRAQGPIEAVPDTAWKIAGAGDLDDDGRADIIWRHSGDGSVYAWLMDGFVPVWRGFVSSVPDLAWEVAAVRDFDADGRGDLLWKKETTGEYYLYLMDGAAIRERGYVNVLSDLDWKIALVADMNGDKRADILWRHASTGETYDYLMDGFSIIYAGPGAVVPDPAWQVIP